MQYIQYRDFPLIASLINYYFKFQQIKAQNETVNYVGNVGDKITFKVASIKVLFYKNNKQYSYYAEPSIVYKLVDDKGNVYKWTTTTEVKEGDTISATIKEHEEYRGEKQNVITRGKIQ